MAPRESCPPLNLSSCPWVIPLDHWHLNHATDNWKFWLQLKGIKTKKAPFDKQLHSLFFSLFFFFFFFFFYTSKKKKSTSKHSNFFLFYFLYRINCFYYYLNKKIYNKTKLFYFFNKKITNLLGCVCKDWWGEIYFSSFKKWLM